jgi:hypothetical protein
MTQVARLEDTRITVLLIINTQVENKNESLNFILAFLNQSDAEE